MPHPTLAVPAAAAAAAEVEEDTEEEAEEEAAGVGEAVADDPPEDSLASKSGCTMLGSQRIALQKTGTPKNLSNL